MDEQTVFNVNESKESILNHTIESNILQGNGLFETETSNKDIDETPGFDEY